MGEVLNPFCLYKSEQDVYEVEFLLCCFSRYDKIGSVHKRGVYLMPVSYKKLWKLLIDKDLKKTDLRTVVGLSTGTLAKLGKNEGVSTDVLVRICHALDCDIGDIMEVLTEPADIKES